MILRESSPSPIFLEPKQPTTLCDRVVDRADAPSRNQ
jgi:hypothetical protein